MTQILIIYGTQLGDHWFTRVEARRGRAPPALRGGKNAALVNTKARGCTPGCAGAAGWAVQSHTGSSRPYTSRCGMVQSGMVRSTGGTAALGCP